MTDDLNTLFAAALEFGSDWRRPLAELASERLPERTDAQRRDLVQTVGACRDAIEDRIRERYEAVNGSWAASGEQAAAESWIIRNFPWVTIENVRRAVSQGVYYAWHG